MNTNDQNPPKKKGLCEGCMNGAPLNFDFDYAYQPIVNIADHTVFAHEALVRGPAGEGAGTVLSLVNDNNRYQFDQACRVKAIKTAAEIGVDSFLSINFLPNAIYRPEVCIRTTLEAARTYGFPVNKIIFETIEGEEIDDGKWLAQILREYKRIGFLTAIDDFGAGYAGMNLLADFQPDIVKLDMGLVRNVDQSRARQAIVRGISSIANELDIRVIAEGVETVDEFHCLRDMGLTLMQGYVFSKPLFRTSARQQGVHWPQ
jgi:EAL domain-containing protein (putative c-di-GMP-specific phosphodiesterase class I)